MKKTKIAKALLSLGFASSFAVGTAYGSAFQLFDQDASQLGNDYAGTIASANSAATEFYNSAGMTNLKHTEISIGATAINTNIKFQGHTATSTIAGSTATADDKALAGGLSVLPNIHIVTPIDDRWALGFGITVPFGLETDYPDYSVAANAATKTSLRAINVGPSIAFKVNNWFSIGGGVDEQYATGVFDQSPVVNIAGVPVATIKLHNKLSDWALGWHASMLFDLSKDARIGINYRSKVNHKPKGTSESVNGDTYVKTGDDVSTQIVLPPTTSIGFYDDLNNAWSVMAKADYTQWNSIPSIILSNVEAGPLGKVTVKLPENFKNTWNFAVGANYKLNNMWTWKMGGGIDESPVNDANRNLRLPDNTHYIASTGLEYKANKNFTMDVGYEHVFVKHASIDNTATAAGSGILALTVTEEGTVSASADLIGAQINYKF